MILWAKAVVLYCKRSCAKSTAIKSLTGETDVDSNCKLLLKGYTVVWEKFAIKKFVRELLGHKLNTQNILPLNK